MRYEDDSLTCCSPYVDLLAKYINRIDIKTGIYLIEYDDRWTQESYLEEFDTTFLTTRESDKKITIKNR